MTLEAILMSDIMECAAQRTHTSATATQGQMVIKQRERALAREMASKA